MPVFRAKEVVFWPETYVQPLGQTQLMDVVPGKVGME